MAKVTVVFKDGESVDGFYSDPDQLMQVIRFVVSGITVQTLTIEM
jgi:thioredoxin-like negative regulator of GroEL